MQVGDKVIVIQGFWKGLKGTIQEVTKEGSLRVDTWILDPFDVEMADRPDLYEPLLKEV